MANWAISIPAFEVVSNSGSNVFAWVCKFDDGPVSSGSSGVHTNSEFDLIILNPVCDIDVIQTSLAMQFKEVFRQSDLLIIQLRNVHILLFSPELEISEYLFLSILSTILDPVVDPKFNHSFIGELIFNFVVRGIPLVLRTRRYDILDPLPNLPTDHSGLNSKYLLLYILLPRFNITLNTILSGHTFDWTTSLIRKK